MLACMRVMQRCAWAVGGVAGSEEHTDMHRGQPGHLGQHGLVHLVLAGGRAEVAAEDGIAADRVAPGVARVLEERAAVPVLLQELPALLGRALLPPLRSHSAVQTVSASSGSPLASPPHITCLTGPSCSCLEHPPSAAGQGDLVSACSVSGVREAECEALEGSSSALGWAASQARRSASVMFLSASRSSASRVSRSRSSRSRLLMAAV